MELTNSPSNFTESDAWLCAQHYAESTRNMDSVAMGRTELNKYICGVGNYEIWDPRKEGRLFAGVSSTPVGAVAGRGGGQRSHFHACSLRHKYGWGEIVHWLVTGTQELEAPMECAKRYSPGSWLEGSVPCSMEENTSRILHIAVVLSRG